MQNRTTIGVTGVLVMLVAACSSLRAGQSSPPPQPSHRILVLTMSAAGGAYSITDSMLVPSTVALSMPPPVADGQSLNYAIADTTGRTLFEASMPNPMAVRAPLSPPGEPQKGHEVVVLPQGEYMIRIPYEPSAATMQVVIGARPVIASGATTAAAPPPPGAQTLSLQPWLRAAEAKAQSR
jgi:hypothetical protein